MLSEAKHLSENVAQPSGCALTTTTASPQRHSISDTEIKWDPLPRCRGFCSSRSGVPGPFLRTWVFSALYALSGVLQEGSSSTSLSPSQSGARTFHSRPAHAAAAGKTARNTSSSTESIFHSSAKTTAPVSLAHLRTASAAQSSSRSGSSPHSGTTIYPADASPEACTHRFVPAGFPLPRESVSCAQTTRSATASSTQSLPDASRQDGSKAEKPPVAAPDRKSVV